MALVVAMMVAALWITGVTDWISFGFEGLNESVDKFQQQTP